MLLLFHVLQPDLLIPTPETSTRVLSNATNRYFTPLNVVVKATSKKGIMHIHYISSDDSSFLDHDLSFDFACYQLLVMDRLADQNEPSRRC